MPRLRSALALSFGLLLCTLPSAVRQQAAAQQAVAPDAGCVEQKGTYHCNLSSLKLALERAHTLAVEAQPRDRAARTQVEALVGELGKGHLDPGVPGDLTVVLLPSTPPGIDLGPSEHEIATLQIYAPSGMSSRGTLLWAEVLRGSGERPWPAQVHLLIQQFQDRLQAH